MFVRTKSMIKMFLTSNRGFQLKYESYIPKIAFFPEKNRLDLEGNLHKSSIVGKRKWPNISKQICWWSLMWEDKTRDGSFHWMKHYYGLWPEVTVKTMDLFLKTHSFSLHKTSQDINWWSEVKWITCGSCLDSDSDGTHSLQRIHWWATDAKCL